MSVSTTRFLLQFGTTGLGSLAQVRSTIKGIESQSYTSLNQASRSFSNLDRSLMRSSNSITRSLNSVLGTLRMFTGFNIGMAGFGGMVSIAERMQRAFMQTNGTLQTSKIIIEELLGKGKAQSFLDTIQTKSAVYGVSLTESMNSSRSIIEAMKISAKDKEVKPQQLDKLLNMTYALNMMDTENRGIQYTAFSIKEMMGGNGRMDFKSMRTRLGINLGANAEKEIAKAFKAGDVDKGIDLFDKALQRVGINADKLLKRLSKEGWVQNISKLQGFVSMSFQRMGESMFNSLTTPLSKFNDWLGKQFKEGARGQVIFKEIGDSISSFISPSIKFLQQFGAELHKNREEAVKLFRAMFGAGANAGTSFMHLFTTFAKGLSGQKEDAGIQSRISTMLEFMKTLEKIGTGITNFFSKLTTPLNNLGLALNNFGRQIITMLGGKATGAGLAGMLGGVINLGAGGINMGANALGGLNNILGNSPNSAYKNGGSPDKQQSGLMGIAQTYGDYAQTTANWAINGLMIYGMLKGRSAWKNRGSGMAGTAGQAGMIAHEGQLAQEVNGARSLTPNKYQTEMRAVYEMQNGYEKRLSDIARERQIQYESHQAKVSRMRAENLSYEKMQQDNLNKRFQIANLTAEKVQAMNPNATPEQVSKYMNDLRLQSKSLLDANLRIEQQKVKNLNTINQSEVERNRKNLRLGQEESEIKRKLPLLQKAENMVKKYGTQDNINTGLNALMTGAMLKSTMGGTAGAVAGSSGSFLAKGFPTIASGLNYVKGFAVATGTEILASMTSAVSTSGFSSLLSAQIAGGLIGASAIAGLTIGSKIRASIEEKKETNREIFRENETNRAVADYKLKRTRNVANFLTSKGINWKMAQQEFAGTSSLEEMSVRYNRSSYENKNAMKTIYQAMKENKINPVDAKMFFGNEGADALANLNMVIEGGKLSVSNMDDVVLNKIENVLVKTLKDRGFFKYQAGGISGDIMTDKITSQQAFINAIVNTTDSWRRNSSIVDNSGK